MLAIKKAKILPIDAKHENIDLERRIKEVSSIKLHKRFINEELDPLKFQIV